MLSDDTYLYYLMLNFIYKFIYVFKNCIPIIRSIFAFSFNFINVILYLIYEKNDKKLSATLARISVVIL